ncbi:MAG: hypothetical protein AAFX10_15775 [Pseudomonadota bacterium]
MSERINDGDRYRQEIDRIVAALGDLRRREDREVAGEPARLHRFLSVLERQCEEIDAQLEEIDPHCHVDRELVAGGLREARRRLRLAARAAYPDGGSAAI